MSRTQLSVIPSGFFRRHLMYIPNLLIVTLVSERLVLLKGFGDHLFLIVKKLSLPIFWTILLLVVWLVHPLEKIQFVSLSSPLYYHENFHIFL